MSDTFKHWKPTQIVEADLVGRDGSKPVKWHVAEEVPVAFVYNGHNHAVMLATPKDMLDFAYGFSFTEGIIDRPEDMRAIEIREREQGVDLMITLNEERLERFLVRQERRMLVGNSSCGICGIDSMESLFKAPKPVRKKPIKLKYKQVIAAVADFQQRQPMKKHNRSVHGACWVNGKGKVKVVREDVGRHNALDKLVGALLQEGTNCSKGYCIASSRASYEMVAKAVRMGMPALVSLSAPTAFAVRTAEEANLTLVNWVFEGMTIF